MISLEEAIRARDSDEVIRLIAAEPRLCRSETSMGVSALMMCLYFELPQAALAIRVHLPDLTFFEAAAMGEMDQVKRAVAEDQSMLDAFAPDGFTVLGLAIFFRQPHIAKWLIESGADVNLAAKNARRVAPIHAACARNDLATLRLLLDAGASPDLAQEGGFTPLRQAIATSNSAMEAMLRAAGASLA